MRVWFHPASEPGIYAVDRTDPDNPIFIISDGLPVDWCAAMARKLATVEERDWVRQHMGSPTVAEDPTYAHLDKVCRGEQLWDRSMIPEGMLWEGASAQRGDRPPTIALVWWGGVAASMVGTLFSYLNGDAGLFHAIPGL